MIKVLPESLQDRSFDLTHEVVVLDDPVSSLDANALYLAFGVHSRADEWGKPTLRPYSQLYGS